MPKLGKGTLNYIIKITFDKMTPTATSRILLIPNSINHIGLAPDETSATDYSNFTTSARKDKMIKFK